MKGQSKWVITTKQKSPFLVFSSVKARCLSRCCWLGFLLAFWENAPASPAFTTLKWRNFLEITAIKSKSMATLTSTYQANCTLVSVFFSFNLIVLNCTFLVFLMGSSSPLHVQRFQRFIINVESTDHPENISPQNVGSFQLYGDNHTTFNEECVNTISEKDNQLKSEIFFMWSAPPPGSGCVTFRFNCIFRTFLITVVLVGFQSYDTWGFSTLVRWWWWSK